MSAPTTHYSLVVEEEQKRRILESVVEWSEIVYKTEDGQLTKVQSLSKNDDGLELTFSSNIVSSGLGFLDFNFRDASFRFEGSLGKPNQGYLFQPANIFRLQLRYFKRMAVPEGYPAFFIIQKMAGQNVSHQTIIRDIHGDGFQFLADGNLALQPGDRAEGLIKIGKFPEVQVGIVVRHSASNQTLSFVGAEIKHLEFGSEAKLAELLLFYRHDVFYFNKEKGRT